MRQVKGKTARPRQQPLGDDINECMKGCFLQWCALGQGPVGSPWPGEMLVAPFPHPTFSGRPSGPTGCGASPGHCWVPFLAALSSQLLGLSPAAALVPLPTQTQHGACSFVSPAPSHMAPDVRRTAHTVSFVCGGPWVGGRGLAAALVVGPACAQPSAQAAPTDVPPPSSPLSRLRLEPRASASAQAFPLFIRYPVMPLLKRTVYPSVT